MQSGVEQRDGDQPDQPGAGAAFSWTRVLKALVLILAVTAFALWVSPTLLTMWGRNSNIGPEPAFEGLALPLQRKMVFTDKPFPPWVAMVKTDGTVTVQRHIKTEWPADKYQQVIVHEYGHALLDDVITDGHYLSFARKRLYELTSSTTRRGTLSDGVPDDVRVIFQVYKRTPADAYESDYWRGAMATHLTDYFGEFVAESFARWRAGEEVDPDVAAALSRMTQGR